MRLSGRRLLLAEEGLSYQMKRVGRVGSKAEHITQPQRPLNWQPCVPFISDKLAIPAGYKGHHCQLTAFSTNDKERD